MKIYNATKKKLLLLIGEDGAPEPTLTTELEPKKSVNISEDVPYNFVSINDILPNKST